MVKRVTELEEAGSSLVEAHRARRRGARNVRLPWLSASLAIVDGGMMVVVKAGDLV